MSESSEDQIHVATPARREQARRDGDIPKSFEMAAALQMIGAIVVSYLLLNNVGNWIRSWTMELWATAGKQTSLETAEFTSQAQHLIRVALAVLTPFMLLLMLVGVASHWAQTGPLFLTKKVVPDFERLGPGNWTRKIFSLESLALVLVGIPKMAVAFGVLGFSVWSLRNQFFQLASYSPDALVAKLFGLVLTVSFHVAFALVITSVADYWLKYLSHQSRLKMTDQQLRDELRTQNGNPQVRARQRDLQKV